MNRCENCLWRGECLDEGVCEDYTPATDEEAEAYDINEYMFDLDDRHELYMEQIEEQDT